MCAPENGGAFGLSGLTELGSKTTVQIQYNEDRVRSASGIGRFVSDLRPGTAGALNYSVAVTNTAPASFVPVHVAVSKSNVQIITAGS
jgi:hypothetical protein